MLVCNTPLLRPAKHNKLALPECVRVQIGRIRAAHELFTALDRQDGRIDGCVWAADLEAYLTAAACMRPEAAADVRERLFCELQVGWLVVAVGWRWGGVVGDCGVVVAVEWGGSGELQGCLEKRYRMH